MISKSELDEALLKRRGGAIERSTPPEVDTGASSAIHIPVVLIGVTASAVMTGNRPMVMEAGKPDEGEGSDDDDETVDFNTGFSGVTKDCSSADVAVASCMSVTSLLGESCMKTSESSQDCLPDPITAFD